MENLDNKENLMWSVPILFQKYQLQNHVRLSCEYADSVFCYLCWIQTCLKEDSVNLVDNFNLSYLSKEVWWPYI